MGSPMHGPSFSKISEITMICRDGEWAFAQNWVEQTRNDMDNAGVHNLSYYCDMADMVRHVLDYLHVRRYHGHLYSRRRLEMDKYLTR